MRPKKDGGGSIMRLVEGFCIREILDETVAIPTQNAAHRLSGLVAMNETGKFLFQLLQSEQSEETLIAKLIENYEIDIETAKKDIKTLICTLRENQLLIENGG